MKQTFGDMQCVCAVGWNNRQNPRTKKGKTYAGTAWENLMQNSEKSLSITECGPPAHEGKSRDNQERELNRISSRSRSSSEGMRKSSTMSVTRKKTRARIRRLRSKQRSTSSSLTFDNPLEKHKHEVQSSQTLLESHHGVMDVVDVEGVQKLSSSSTKRSVAALSVSTRFQRNTSRERSTSGTEQTSKRTPVTTSWSQTRSTSHAKIKKERYP